MFRRANVDVSEERYCRDLHKSVKNPKSYSWDGFMQQIPRVILGKEICNSQFASVRKWFCIVLSILLHMYARLSTRIAWHFSCVHASIPVWI